MGRTLGSTKSYQGRRHAEERPGTEAEAGQPSASQGQASEEANPGVSVILDFQLPGWV